MSKKLIKHMRKVFPNPDPVQIAQIAQAMGANREGLDWESYQSDSLFSDVEPAWLIWFARPFLARANLSHANLPYANLTRACLWKANLCGVNLSGADLSRADLSGADLRCADLSKTSLVGASLVGTDLRQASLLWADLSWADTYRAQYDRFTRFSADFDPVAAGMRLIKEID